MHHCKAAATPQNAKEKFQLEDGTDVADPSHYRILTGGFNYLIHTRPDIIFSISVLSRYMHSSTKQHLGVAKTIICYVAGTVDFGIW